MPLTDIEVRILGSLVEKEATTPDNYPLSLNALVAACNQSSSRDPVMALSEVQVRSAVNNLRQQSLVRGLQPADSRVLKFQHLVREKLGVDDGALSALGLLMLRGPQTLGELRSRGARLVGLGDATAVEASVRALREKELAAELPRQHGQKEERYAHLLSGPPVDNAPTPW